MPRYRATIGFEDAPNKKALDRLGSSYRFELEAHDADEALEKASSMVIGQLASDLYPPEPAFCSGCECTKSEMELDGTCPDCGGHEWLPAMTPEIVMAWAEGMDWQVEDITEVAQENAD